MAEADEPVRACFLGSPDVDVETKAVALAQYTGPPNNWLNRTGPANVRSYWK